MENQIRPYQDDEQTTPQWNNKFTKKKIPYENHSFSLKDGEK